MLSSDQILGGLAVVVVIALGCELLAARTRLPAIVLLLPAGFTAGAITNDADPNLESREAQFEDITDALLLTENDGFNALMAVELQRELGEDHVYRLPPRVMTAELPRAAGRRKLFGEKGHILFAEQLTYDELTRRFNRGAEFIVAPPVSRPMGMSLSSDHMRLLFVVAPTGELRVVTAVPGPGPRDGDTTVWLAMRAGFSDKQRPPSSTADSEVPTANA